MSSFYRLLPTTTFRVVLARLQSSSSKSGPSPTSGQTKGGFSGGSATSSSTMGTTSADPDLGRSSSSTVPITSGGSGATSTGQSRGLCGYMCEFDS